MRISNWKRAIGREPARNGHLDKAPRGELHGVAQQVDENLDNLKSGGGNYPVLSVKMMVQRVQKLPLVCHSRPAVSRGARPW